MQIASIKNILLRNPLLKNLSVVGVESFVVKAINALYFIIIARIITKEALGMYSWVISITAFVGAFLTSGVGKVISRRVAVNIENWKSIFTSMIRFYLVGTLIVGLIGGIVLYYHQEKDYLYLYLGLIQVLVSVFAMVYRETLIGLSQFEINAKASISNVVVKVLLGILAIYLIDHIAALLFALIISNVVVVIYYSTKLKILELLKETPLNKTEIYSILKEGLPLFGVVLFDSAISRFDQVYLGALGNIEALGNYSFTYKIYELLWIPFVIAGVVFFPKISVWCKSEDSFNKKFDNILSFADVVVLISSFCAFLVCVFWTPVIDFLTQGKYGTENQELIALLALAIPFVSCIGILWNILMGLQRGKVILLITVIIGVFNISVNYFAIKYFSATGAAIANIFSNVFQLGLYLFFVSKINSKIFGLVPQIFKILIISILLYLICQYFDGFLPRFICTAIFSVYTLFYLKNYLQNSNMIWKD